MPGINYCNGCCFCIHSNDGMRSNDREYSDGFPIAVQITIYISRKPDAFHHFTVAENAEIPLHLVNTPRNEQKERVGEVLKLFAFDHRAKHCTYELSGGEQQRMAISRALDNPPTILLANEPNGQIDSHIEAIIIQLLHDIV